MSAANITATTHLKVLLHYLDALTAPGTIQADPGVPLPGVTVSGAQNFAYLPIGSETEESVELTTWGPYTTGDDGTYADMLTIAPGPYNVGPGDEVTVYLPLLSAGLQQLLEDPSPFTTKFCAFYSFQVDQYSVYGPSSPTQNTSGYSGGPFGSVSISGISAIMETVPYGTILDNSMVYQVGEWTDSGGESGQYPVAYYTPSRAAEWYQGDGGVGVYIAANYTFPVGQPTMALPVVDGDGNLQILRTQWDPFANVDTGSLLHDLDVVVHIVIERPRKPAVPVPVTNVTVEHFTRGQIALPHGSGSPLLYLLSSQTRTTTVRSYTLETTYIGPGNLVPSYSLVPYAMAEIVSSDLRASVSKDGGYSWSPAVDVGMMCQDDGDLADGRVTNLDGAKRTDGGGFSSSVAWTGTLGNTCILPQTIYVSPSGKLFVRAATQRYFAGSVAGDQVTALDQGYQDTVAPRVCEVATLTSRNSDGVNVSAFQDATTANQTYGSVSHSVAAPASAALYVVGSAGNYQGSRGQGGQSLGASALYMLLEDASGEDDGAVYARFVSSDGGDTWAADATWDSSLYIEAFVRDQAICQYGLVDASAASGKVYPFDVMVQAPLADGLARGTGLGGGGAYGQSIWDLPADGSSRVSYPDSAFAVTRGPANSPATTKTIYPSIAADGVGGLYYWNGHYCCIVAADGVLTSYVSEDDGQTFIPTVKSLDNMKSWSNA